MDTRGRVQRAGTVPGSLSKAVLCPHQDPEFGSLSRVLCLLERLSADTLPGHWSSVPLSSLQFVKVEKSLLCGEGPWNTFFSPSKGHPSWLPQRLELLKPKLSLHMSVILHCHICSKTDLQGFLGRAAAVYTHPCLPAPGGGALILGRGHRAPS